MLTGQYKLNTKIEQSKEGESSQDQRIVSAVLFIVCFPGHFHLNSYQFYCTRSFHTRNRMGINNSYKNPNKTNKKRSLKMLQRFNNSFSWIFFLPSVLCLLHFSLSVCNCFTRHHSVIHRSRVQCGPKPLGKIYAHLNSVHRFGQRLA